MQHMCQCNTCAIATHVPMQHHISWINLEMSHKLMTQVLQWHICCNGASVALAHVLHWHIGACNFKSCGVQHIYFCCNGTCVAMAHLLQWHICCIGTYVAIAHWCMPKKSWGHATIAPHTWRRINILFPLIRKIDARENATTLGYLKGISR